MREREPRTTESVFRLESRFMDAMDAGGFYTWFERVNPPPAVPLDRGAQDHSWTNWFKYFMLTFSIFLTVKLHLSSLDWTRAESGGGDGWSLSTLKAGDPEGCRHAA